ncbi:FIVAR domain-containing protein, partial [Bifidobacterium sp. 82T10]|nr:FIVAR domain-containing protein [Bifidobacterium miconis]
AYTPESWTPFAKALADAKTVQANADATQTEVDNATKTLTDAQAGLKKAADKTALNKAIADAKTKQQKDYTDDSWDSFAKALAAAETTAAKTDATQAEVDAAEKALTDAANALVKKPEPSKKADKTALDAAVKTAESKKQDAYTPESWTPFAKALADAKTVQANADATQTEVDNATKTLTDAQSALTKKPSTPGQPDQDKDKDDEEEPLPVPVYRLFNPKTNLHLYTADSNEKNVLANKQGWKYEGVVFNAAHNVAGATPVHRLYNPKTGRHLLSLDGHERQVLTTQRGWKDEGVAWYQVDTGTVPVYRMYAPSTDEHLYTTDVNEYRLNATRGWNQEGVAWKGLK